MNQDQLDVLALLSTETQLLQKIDYEVIIDVFCADQSEEKNACYLPV